VRSALGLDLDAIVMDHDLLDQEVQVVLRHGTSAEMKMSRITS
jgi:hypothetical protein